MVQHVTTATTACTPYQEKQDDGLDKSSVKVAALRRVRFPTNEQLPQDCVREQARDQCPECIPERDPSHNDGQLADQQQQLHCKPASAHIIVPHETTRTTHATHR